MPSELKAKILQKQLKLRKQLWPDVKDEDLWYHRRKDGFIPIPRVMPLILKIMDHLGSRPLSWTYLDLWCRKWDEQFITVNRPLTEYAFYAGFAKQRGVQTWRERIRELEKLKFLRIEAGANGDISYILILNPLKVIEWHAEHKTTNLPKNYLNALRARSSQVEAKDLQKEEQEALNRTNK
jgi:hypothetical protein